MSTAPDPAPAPDTAAAALPPVEVPPLDAQAPGWLRGRAGAPGAVVAYGGAGLSAGADALTPVEAELLLRRGAAGRAPAGRVPGAHGER